MNAFQALRQGGTAAGALCGRGAAARRRGGRLHREHGPGRGRAAPRVQKERHPRQAGCAGHAARLRDHQEDHPAGRAVGRAARTAGRIGSEPVHPVRAGRGQPRLRHHRPVRQFARRRGSDAGRVAPRKNRGPGGDCRSVRPDRDRDGHRIVRRPRRARPRDGADARSGGGARGGAVPGGRASDAYFRDARRRHRLRARTAVWRQLAHARHRARVRHGVRRGRGAQENRGIARQLRAGTADAVHGKRRHGSHARDPVLLYVHAVHAHRPAVPGRRLRLAAGAARPDCQPHPHRLRRGRAVQGHADGAHRARVATARRRPGLPGGVRTGAAEIWLMIKINLLPHREARRKQRQAAFIALLALGGVVGMAVVLMVGGGGFAGRPQPAGLPARRIGQADAHRRVPERIPAGGAEGDGGRLCAIAGARVRTAAQPVGGVAVAGKARADRSEIDAAGAGQDGAQGGGIQPDRQHPPAARERWRCGRWQGGRACCGPGAGRRAGGMKSRIKRAVGLKLDLNPNLGELGARLAAQFRNLNGRHPGQWPLAPRLLCAAGVAVAAIGAGYFFYWSGQFEAEDAGAQAEVRLRDEYRLKTAKAINLDALRAQKIQVDRYVDRLQKQLPSKAEMAALLTDINQAGSGRGLQFELFKPAQVVLRDYYAELPIDIKVTGSYHDIGARSARPPTPARRRPSDHDRLPPLIHAGPAPVAGRLRRPRRAGGARVDEGGRCANQGGRAAAGRTQDLRAVCLSTERCARSIQCQQVAGGAGQAGRPGRRRPGARHGAPQGAAGKLSARHGQDGGHHGSARRDVRGAAGGPRRAPGGQGPACGPELWRCDQHHRQRGHGARGRPGCHRRLGAARRHAGTTGNQGDRQMTHLARRQQVHRTMQLLMGLFLLVCACASTGARAQGDNAIEAITASQQGASLVVRVTMTEPPGQAPVGFAINNPPRIVLDFGATANRSGKLDHEFGSGELRSVNVVQSGDRARLVFNLNRPLGHAITVDGKAIVVTIDTSAGAVAVSAPAAAAPVAPTAAGPAMLRGIDFRRGENGEGRVIVELPREASTDVRQTATGVVVDFLKIGVPELLRRRLDRMGCGSRACSRATPSWWWTCGLSRKIRTASARARRATAAKSCRSISRAWKCGRRCRPWPTFPA
uniref:AMIN domain-containing protein n=1 Tax=Tanacetum cinerariifolium TaxID=118510 RepID=A0A699GF60_TANCI|nr:hypothetical protein [Tanacetum cinerariifolium]